jgi:UDP-N-acetylmuramoyl-L-alanyl-D-glutamate--2,6-diaminopimelate ligase
VESLKLSSFLQLLQSSGLWLEGTLSGDATSVLADTRKLTGLGSSEKVLFFARKGVTFDGHDFLQEIDACPQVIGIVGERLPVGLALQKPFIRVRSSAQAMALAVKSLWEDPSSKMLLAAVTGTNGKTTTTFLMQSLLSVLGYRVARFGTIETEFEGFSIPSELTTPDFEELQRRLADLGSKGATAAVFEASSHALDQGRLLGLEVDATVFTNLTAEHLDYHRSMENYYAAKRKLFTELLKSSAKKKKWAVVPDDGSFGSRLIEDLKGVSEIALVVWTSNPGKSKAADYLLRSFETSLSGTQLEVVDCKTQKAFSFHSFLPGHYNAENVMGMIALGFALGASPAQIQQSLDKMSPVSGRLERVVRDGQGFVFVDYAHTPDALENVLRTLRGLTKGKLKVVFGCGGDRDRGKRPKMGEVAELYADEIFVTSDNPRTEDPEGIIREIVQGMQRLKPCRIDVDRRKTIERALKDLGVEDVLLIAGKGHEKYQIIGTQKLPFDDREVVQSFSGS